MPGTPARRRDRPVRHIVWTDDVVHHLLVERADRGISVDEVNQVLTAPETIEVAPFERYVGSTAAGRCLAVVAIGDQEMWVRTAWEIKARVWRKWDARA